MLKNRQGRVKWFQENVGYIRDNEGDEDFFFHWSDISTPDETGYYVVYPGDSVVFDIVDTGHKLKASNIRVSPAVSTNGKPLVKIIHMGAPRNMRIAEMNVKFLSKTQFGIRYISSYKNKIFGSSEQIVEADMEEVYSFSIQGKGFCSTEDRLSFDITFI